MILQANGSLKIPGLVILVSAKTDFTPKKVRRDKNGQYIKIKGKIK